jgi:hypothetical protein
MTSPLEPSPSGDAAAALAVQVAALRGQVRLIFARLDMAGITGDLNLADQFAELARAVTQALDSPPRGPAAPYWIGLDPADHARQLTELRQWTDTVLRREYGGYQLRGCWANHPHAIWELSTLAAEWHRTYSRNRPDVDRALEFHDRWLPGTMRRIGDVTRRCNPECAARRPAPKAAHGLTPFAQQPPPASGKDPRHDHRQAHLG